MEAEELIILVNKIKEDLLRFRNGRSRIGRKIPVTIRNELLKLHNLGWSVAKIELEFNLGSTAIYRWIKSAKMGSKKTEIKLAPKIRDTNAKQKSAIKKLSKQTVQKPKKLKIIDDRLSDLQSERANDFNKNVLSKSSFDKTLQLEFRSGVRLTFPYELLNINLLKSLNSL
jgi:hypothetical protein